MPHLAKTAALAACLLALAGSRLRAQDLPPTPPASTPPAQAQPTPIVPPERTPTNPNPKPESPAAAALPPNAPLGIKFGGFLRHDAIWDSRQVVGAREASVLLWPRDVVKDAAGTDINEASHFQMLAIISRLSGAITGPDVLGAKTSGILEAEFFGNTEASINEFRLRHAWIRLDWANTQLGLGQYWNPLTVIECYPGVVNFSTGAPFMPFNRNPQIRLTQKIKNFNVVLAAVSQRDFSSSTEPYRNSGLPAGHLQVQYKTEAFVAGVASHLEQLRPKLSGGTPLQASNERVTSLSLEAYAKLTTKPVIVKAQVFSGQNAGSFVMLGGFVGYTLPGKVETYQTMNTQSAWVDFTSTNKKIAPGLFFGYTENKGANDPVAGAVAATYGLPAALSGIGAGTGRRTINNIYRVSPRVEFLFNKLRFGLEYELTAAEWGDAEQDGTASQNLTRVKNHRAILATIFSF